MYYGHCNIYSKIKCNFNCAVIQMLYNYVRGKNRQKQPCSILPKCTEHIQVDIAAFKACIAL